MKKSTEYFDITKRQYISLLKSYYKAPKGTVSQDYFYHQACALETLLELFGCDKDAIEEMKQLGAKPD